MHGCELRESKIEFHVLGNMRANKGGGALHERAQNLLCRVQGRVRKVLEKLAEITELLTANCGEQDLNNKWKIQILGVSTRKK